jgi:hypothetical protein
VVRRGTANPSYTGSIPVVASTEYANCFAYIGNRKPEYAEVVELVYTRDLKFRGHMAMRVRSPPSAQLISYDISYDSTTVSISYDISYDY